MLVIGIAGGTGSGKTTVVSQIINELQPMKFALSHKTRITRQPTTFLTKNEQKLISTIQELLILNC